MKFFFKKSGGAQGFLVTVYTYIFFPLVAFAFCVKIFFLQKKKKVFFLFFFFIYFLFYLSIHLFIFR